jgi:hypothetical protein
MPDLTTPNFTIGLTATKVSNASTYKRGVQLQVNTAGKYIFVGGPDVTASGSTKGIKVSDTDALWGIETDAAVWVIAAEASISVTALVAPS